MKWPVDPVVSEQVSLENLKVKALVSLNADQAAEQADSVSVMSIKHFSSWIRLKKDGV